MVTTVSASRDSIAVRVPMQSPERNQPVDTISCVPFASKYRHSRPTGQTEKFPEAP